MSVQRRILDIGLRYQLSDSPARWERILGELYRWHPSLRPTHVYRLTDPDSEQPDPWSDRLAEELARRCAVSRNFGWLLFRNDDGRVGLSIGRRGPQVEIRLSLRDTFPDCATALLGLLALFAKDDQPAVATLYDADLPEEHLPNVELAYAQELPALLYLDEQSAAAAGGMAHLRAAPCPALEPPGGGIILLIRPSVWGLPSPAEQEQIDAVTRHLGIRPRQPLRLIPVEEEPVHQSGPGSDGPPDHLVTILSPYKGSTVPDYEEEISWLREWVLLLSMPLAEGPRHRGIYQVAVAEARRYRYTAPRDAKNFPATDKFSLHLVRDPGPDTRGAMLDVLFSPGSPIHRVRFGETWYGPPVMDPKGPVYPETPA